MEPPDQSVLYIASVTQHVGWRPTSCSCCWRAAIRPPARRWDRRWSIGGVRWWLARAVAGFDATFSAPKSPSVWWALTDDAGLLEAHDVAVTTALEHLPRLRRATPDPVPGATGWVPGVGFEPTRPLGQGVEPPASASSATPGPWSHGHRVAARRSLMSTNAAVSAVSVDASATTGSAPAGAQTSVVSARIRKASSASAALTWTPMPRGSSTVGMVPPSAWLSTADSIPKARNLACAISASPASM